MDRAPGVETRPRWKANDDESLITTPFCLLLRATLDERALFLIADPRDQ